MSRKLSRYDLAIGRGFQKGIGHQDIVPGSIYLYTIVKVSLCYLDPKNRPYSRFNVSLITGTKLMYEDEY